MVSSRFTSKPGLYRPPAVCFPPPPPLPEDIISGCWPKPIKRTQPARAYVHYQLNDGFNWTDHYLDLTTTTDAGQSGQQTNWTWQYTAPDFQSIVLELQCAPIGGGAYELTGKCDIRYDEGGERNWYAITPFYWPVTANTDPGIPYDWQIPALQTASGTQAAVIDVKLTAVTNPT